VIAHVVLFRPRPSLDSPARAAFVQTLQGALEGIPSIARAHVGRRINLGRFYDQHNAESFPFVAILEFASEDDLRSYLDHPAHLRLGQQVYEHAEAALAFDFEMLSPARAIELL
jgi:hypothetical protein